MDREVHQVLMMKEDEVNEMGTVGRWSVTKEEVVVTEEIMEQVFVEQTQVIEMRETEVEEQCWSIDQTGEVVEDQTGEVVVTEEVWISQKPVVEVSEMVEEQWFIEKGEVVTTTDEKVEQGVFMMTTEDVKQVSTNTLVGVVMGERWSVEKGEAIVTEEVGLQEEVFGVQEMVEEHWSSLEKGNGEVNDQVLVDKKQLSLGLENEEVVVGETVSEPRPLGEEVFLNYTKTIYGRWKKQLGQEIADGESEDGIVGNYYMWNTRESCEARVEYEKAVRKYLSHTTHCSKCVVQPQPISVIIVIIRFILQFVHHLVISSGVTEHRLIRRTWTILEQSYEIVVTSRAYVFIIKKPGVLISRTLSGDPTGVIPSGDHRSTPTVVKSGDLLRRARSIIKQSYESVVTTSVFVYITTSYVSITQTLQRFLISIMQQDHAAVDEVPEGVNVNTHDQVVDPFPLVIVTSSGVTKQGLITRTWFVLEQSYHLIRVVTVKAYVSIKQTIIVIRRHTFGEVIPELMPEEVNENSQHDVSVDQSTTVVVTPSGFNIHRLIRRTRLVLQQSFKSVVTRLYVFLQETQGFVCRTKVVLAFSSITGVTIKAYISVKQTINRLLKKKPAMFTPLPGSSDMTDSKVQVRRSRLFFFGVVCILLCLSGTLLFMVNREYHIAVTTKEDGSKSNKQVGSDGVIGKKDHVVAEKKDDKVTTKQTDGKVDAKHKKNNVVNNKKDEKATGKNSDGKVDVKQEKVHVVNEKMDDKTASKKSDGKTDNKHEKDHVVNEKNDDKTAAKQPDDKVDAKHEKDHVVNEKKDDKTAAKQSDGKVDAKQEKDNVVNEKKDDKTVSKKSDGKVDVKHEKDHVVNEKNDDKTAAKQPDGKVDAKHKKDNVVNVKKDDKTAAKQLDGKVDVKQEKDNVVNEKKDDKMASKKSDGKADAKHEKDHVVNEKKDDKTASKKSDGKADARKEVGDLVTKKRDDKTLVITEGFLRPQISYVTTLVLNIHIRIWSTIKQTYHRVLITWKNNLVTDQRYGDVASNEFNVQEKDDVVRLLKTWISYANLIMGIGVLSFVFLCVYIAIKNLRRTTINVVTTVIKGVTGGSLFVARTIVVTAGVFVWTIVNIPRRTWSVLYTWVVTTSLTKEQHSTKKKDSKHVITGQEDDKEVVKKDHVVDDKEDKKAAAKHGKNHVVGDKKNENAAAKHGKGHVVDEKGNEAASKHGKNPVLNDKKNEKESAKHGKDHVVNDKKKEKEGAKHGKDHVVDDKGNEKAGAKHGKDHVVDEIKHVRNGKVGGSLVTNNTDDNEVVKNEGLLIKSRISYVTNLVLNVHIRTWSTIKHTYHRVFTGKNDSHLAPDQGDGNVAPDNVSKKLRVVITQIKYMISQVLKVHKWFVVEQVYHRIFKWREQTKVVTNQDANVVTNQITVEDVVVGPEDRRVTMWFAVKQVYHRVFKWREQTTVITSQEGHDNVLTNQTVEDEDRRVTMWSLVKQTSYQLVVVTKLRLRSWTTTHVTTQVQTGLLRIWSVIKLEKVLNVKVLGQATKKLLLWLRHLVSKEEILKSIVYGGLTEIIASISIVAFFADFDTTILNVVAFALAGLIGGCFFFVTNIWGLKKGGGKTYTEQLGRVNYFPFHATLAMLSFILFGMIPPSTFVFSFLKTNDKKLSIWIVSAVSLLCLSLLAIFKAYVITSITYRFKYVRTVLWYQVIALGVSICSCLASKMVKGSIEDIGLFDTSTCDAMSMSRHNYKV